MMEKRTHRDSISVAVSSASWRMLLLLLLLSICLSSVKTHKDVPVHKWKIFGEITRNEDFFNKHLNRKPAHGANLTQTEENFLYDAMMPGSSRAQEIVAGQVAEPCGCVPSDTPVPIPPVDDSRFIRWPTCTRVARCGGCCGTDVLECVATRKQDLKLQVMKVVYSDSESGDFELVGLDEVTLTQDLECGCRCRIQPVNCNPEKHDYDEESCSCRCRNKLEATTCPSHKTWNDKECACVCRLGQTNKCLTDEFFSVDSCSCQRLRVLQLDACANVTCRSGYQPFSSGSSCTCRLASRSAAVRSRSSAGGFWSRGSSSKFNDLSD